MVELGEFWTLNNIGDLKACHLLAIDGRLRLHEGGSNFRDLGPWTELAERAVSVLRPASYNGLNYFRDYEKISTSSAATIVELLDECEWRCPTCIAASAPGKGRVKPLLLLAADIRTALRDVEAGQLFLSGGEPTIHPNFLDVLATAQAASGQSEFFVITNGRRISSDVAFCSRLAEVAPSAHVYLQFDSFRQRDLRLIRGGDYSLLRESAIRNLELHRIPYTLVCVVMRNVNDDILGQIVDTYLPLPMCRGVTFQPVKFIGRNESASLSENGISALEVSRLIERQSVLVRAAALNPHPANPLNWHIRYFSNAGGAADEWRSASTLYRCDEKASSLKRVSVIWHTDVDNFVAESVCFRPISVIERASTVPLMLHYRRPTTVKTAA